MKTSIPNVISKKWLRDHPNYIFVFGDNIVRRGLGGAAKLREEPNTYGFITKKYPNNHITSFYKPEEYKEVFKTELIKLKKEIESNPDKIFLISQLGAGLANKYNIFGLVIRQGLKELEKYDNVEFLYENWKYY